MISRRDFVKAGAMAPLAYPSQNIFANRSSALKREKGPLIKKFTIFESSGSFYRFVGMNSYDKAPKGVKGSRTSYKVELSDGTVGIGTVGYSRINEEVVSKVRQLIGKDLFSFYRWDNDRISGVADEMKPFFFDTRYSWVESGLLDALGKIRNVPVWKLMGEGIREGIDPYDGTLYFEDIANNTDAQIIGDIARKIKADGYRAVKLKLGRPSKWMAGEAGLNRDIEAFIAVREAVGENFNIMADANNGYENKFDMALKLMKACAPYNVYFMEELFPDDAALYLRLREALLREGFFIRIAEGENIRELDKFDAYVRDGVYNFLQPDMPTCGMSYFMYAARKNEGYRHVKFIPHVWQSQIGLIMSLHASRVQSNICYVEDSRYFEHAFMFPGYLFKDGQWFIPDKPGWGIELSPDYRQFLVGEETVIG